MLNLTITNIKRLFKTRSFQIGTGAVAGIGLFQIIILILDYHNGTGSPYFDSALFAISIIGVFALAAIISLFVGSDYSDGAIRNKLVVGHGRSAVYLSQLFTTVVIGVMEIVAWSAAYLILGMIFLKSEQVLMCYLGLYLGLFMEFVAFASIFTFISMILANKAASAVVSILLSIVILMSGGIIEAGLNEPEVYSPEIIVSDDGEVFYSGENEPNPNYIPEGSVKRACYELMMDVIPGGQALQIAEMQVNHMVLICLYDIGWFVLLSALGIFIFNRKDLK